MPEARGEVSVDDDRLRVTTWTFDGPGSATGHHRHEFDYLVVPVTGGTFEVVELDGSVREMSQVAGSPYLGKRRHRPRRHQRHGRPRGLRRDRAQALSAGAQLDPRTVVSIESAWIEPSSNRERTALRTARCWSIRFI